MSEADPGDDGAVTSAPLGAPPAADPFLKCTSCACPVCMADRACFTHWTMQAADSFVLLLDRQRAQTEMLARIEEALAILVDRQRAEQLHSPAIRALAAERNRTQRFALVIGQYLDGKATREALAFTLNDVMGAP